MGRAGASVMIAARREPVLKDAVARLQSANVLAEGFVADVCEADAARALADETISSLGAIDIVVNNVGGSFGEGFVAGPLLDMTEADFAGVMRANVTSMLNCCWAIVPKMIARGSGTVINVASVVVRQPMPGLGLYSASKAAVVSLTRTMAAEWGPQVG
jgi:gluconate 5-dehydrogenase/2-deoxy-D-gluconate 3-dehydrogenase